MKPGKATLAAITLIFLISELIFNYWVIKELGGFFFDLTIKTVFFLVVIFLFSKGINWAKWLLSVLLILYGFLCLLAGMESGWGFYLIGAYDIFFAIYIHKSKALKLLIEPKNMLPELQDKTKQDSGMGKVPKVLIGYRFPSLLRRVKAIFIDGIFLLSILVVIMLVVQESSHKSTIVIIVYLLILAVYEPVLTAYSRTFGQKLMGIRVVTHSTPTSKISIVHAYLRWLVKGLFGWLSFITIHYNVERRAIHDLASDSVMIIHN
jgi:uncharacterized RDD family membrane protein YckC